MSSTVSKSLVEKFLKENGAEFECEMNGRIVWIKNGHLIQYRKANRLDIEIFMELAEDLDCHMHDLDQFLGDNKIM